MFIIKWILVDVDMFCQGDTVDFNFNDVPRDKFISGATAYLSLRNGKYKENEICYASNPLTLGLIASIRSLFMIFTFNE